MREIKFRAWDGERMLHFTQSPWTCSEYNSICWEVDEEEAKEFLGCLRFEKEPMLMQFTGLVDKNGKEIYEGDVVLFVSEVIVQQKGGFSLTEPEGNIGVIKYAEGSFYVGGEYFYSYGDRNFEWKELEIIGDIYQNPELCAKNTATS